MRDINSSLIVLLPYGTLYLQQSSLAPVWLFFKRKLAKFTFSSFYVTLNNTSFYVFIIGLSSLHVMYFTAM